MPVVLASATPAAAPLAPPSMASSSTGSSFPHAAAEKLWLPAYSQASSGARGGSSAPCAPLQLRNGSSHFRGAASAMIPAAILM